VHDSSPISRSDVREVKRREGSEGSEMRLPDVYASCRAKRRTEKKQESTAAAPGGWAGYGRAARSVGVSSARPGRVVWRLAPFPLLWPELKVLFA
jgi:hypothetical protein